MRKLPIGEKIFLAFIVAPFVVLFGFLASGAVRTYRNPTGSMEPTIPAGSRFITIRTDTANRGDIISFRYPLNPNVWFAKRVVGVGGDIVEIRAKHLFVNGKEVTEPYAVHVDSTTYPKLSFLPEPYRSRDHFGPLRLQPRTFFVLGDNRDQSSDSRYWGAVPQENVRGRVILLYSWSRGFWRPN